MKSEVLFYRICWFGNVQKKNFVYGRYGKARELLGPGMDSTGKYRKSILREVQEFPCRTERYGKYPVP
jgi:hypothetical protein